MAKRPNSSTSAADSTEPSNQFQLPSFADPYGRMLVACGNLADNLPQEFTEALPESDVVAEFGAPEHPTLVDLWVQSARKKHLHVVVSSSKYTGTKPKPNTDASELEGLISKLYGLPLDVTAYGRFEVPVTDLPPKGIVRGAMETVQVKIADVSLRQTGGEYSVAGASGLQNIEWSLIPSKNLVRIEIAYLSKEVVQPAYLRRLYELCYIAFKRWLMGDDNATS